MKYEKTKTEAYGKFILIGMHLPLRHVRQLWGGMNLLTCQPRQIEMYIYSDTQVLKINWISRLRYYYI
jgi:hypothetical protein